MPASFPINVDTALLAIANDPASYITIMHSLVKRNYLAVCPALTNAVHNNSLEAYQDRPRDAPPGERLGPPAEEDLQEDILMAEEGAATNEASDEHMEDATSLPKQDTPLIPGAQDSPQLIIKPIIKPYRIAKIKNPSANTMPEPPTPRPEEVLPPTQSAAKVHFAPTKPPEERAPPPCG